jgi:molybdenum cofactor guanylyltransferase
LWWYIGFAKEKNGGGIMAEGLIILTGGKSSRMGTNKALLPIEGKTNIEHTIETLGPLFAHTLLVTNAPDMYSWLNVPLTTDRYPGLGPLAGIHAGLLASPCDKNLVVACDMPFVSVSLASYLVNLEENVDAIVPSWESQLQPLFAVYRRNCLSTMEKCLIEGKLRIVNFLNQLSVRFVETEELKLVIQNEEPFTNMNTPEEYERVLAKKRL